MKLSKFNLYLMREKKYTKKINDKQGTLLVMLGMLGNAMLGNLMTPSCLYIPLFY